MYKTVREAYDHVYVVEFKFATFKGLTSDEASRRANILAVKYAWKEFNK